MTLRTSDSDDIREDVRYPIVHLGDERDEEQERQKTFDPPVRGKHFLRVIIHKGHRRSYFTYTNKNLGHLPNLSSNLLQRQ